MKLFTEATEYSWRKIITGSWTLAVIVMYLSCHIANISQPIVDYANIIKYEVPVGVQALTLVVWGFYFGKDPMRKLTDLVGGKKESATASGEPPKPEDA